MPDNWWKDLDPAGGAGEIDPTRFRNLGAVLRQACERFGDRPAFSSLGHTLSYRALYRLSEAFAAYLQQHTDLVPGDRIAVQLPNLLQFPVAVFGALRAGLVVVNTNPLYTAPELQHQLRDSGAVALLCLANMAHLAETILPHTALRRVIVTEVGDLLPPYRRVLVNAMVRYVKRLVPAYHMPQAVPWCRALALGRAGPALREADPEPDAVAVLQYTGGTTGIAKGAMLTQRNLVANMLQCRALVGDVLREGSEVVVAPLPLYHIYAFTLHCLALLSIGAHNVLILNPRDLPAFIRTLGHYRFTGFVGLNTLFVALCQEARFRRLDFSALKITLSGGMALQHSVAERWQAVTGCAIAEGYGLTETSPVVSANPLDRIRLGTIGLPLPATRCKVIDDAGRVVPPGLPGELCVQGPQVMKGYWQSPEATAEVLDADGWLKTGDIAVIEADGYLRLVDRKKDMILVSGFNVYPNELEDVLATLPGVLQCAAIGVPDERTGEAIKLFVVRRPGAALDEETIRRHLRAHLTGYKRPRDIEFRDRLPTTNVGKILRRALREDTPARPGTA